MISALTFLAGSLAAYGLAERVEIAFLVPFAAGNFVYIALADLLPEISTARELTDRLIHMARFVLGLGLLLAVAAAT